MQKTIAVLCTAACAACVLTPTQLMAEILVSQNLGASAYNASASLLASTGPEKAFDGSLGSSWNAGATAMQWIEVDLQQTRGLTSFSLKVAQSPDGDTTHQLWVSNSAILGDLSSATLLHTFSGFTANADVLTYTLPGPVSARFVQVRTTASPSWVAWSEVQMFAVPEPATPVLVGSALLMIGGLRLVPRRRRH